MTKIPAQNESMDKKVEERAFDRLSKILKTANIRIEKGTEQTTATLSARDEAEYVSMKLLLELAGIEPWEDVDRLSLSINRFDIALLIELGVMSDDTLLPRELNDINTGVDDDITSYIAKGAPLSRLEKIPDLFDKKLDLDQMSEKKEGEEENFSYGNTSYLYKIYRHKYRREAGGKVFKRLKINGVEVEEEITTEEQDAILERAKEGDERARNEFLIMNIGLVYLVALNMNRWNPRPNLADLLQEALIRMNKCIDTYDKNRAPEELLAGELRDDGEIEIDETSEDVSIANLEQPRNAKFSTYAVKSMQYGLLKLSYSERLVHIPVDIRNKFSKISRIIDGLNHKHGHADRDGVVKQIAFEFAISTDRADFLYDTFMEYRDETLIDITDITDDPEYSELLADNEADPSFKHDVDEGSRVVWEMLDTLTPREKKVLSLRHGIEAQQYGRKSPKGYELTSEETGDLMDVTKDRIRSIESKAIRKLKHPSRSNKLREVL